MDWKNEEGYKVLFNAYYNVLCNYAYKILQNDMDAEDVVIEVFVHFWTNKDKIKVEEGKLKSYLFSSVKNKAFELIRSGKIREKHNQYYSDIMAANADDSSLDEDLFLIREALKRSLRHLSPKTKEVYLLRTQNGLTFAEIAAALNINRRTAENHMANAIKKLRELVKENMKIYNS